MIREHKLQSEPHNLKTRCRFVGRERNRESSICGFFSYHLDSLWWLGIFSTTGSLKPNHNILKTTTCVWDHDVSTISWVPKLNLEVKATSRRKWKLSPNLPKLFWHYHHLKKFAPKNWFGKARIHVPRKWASPSRPSGSLKEPIPTSIQAAHWVQELYFSLST